MRGGNRRLRLPYRFPRHMGFWVFIIIFIASTLLCVHTAVTLHLGQTVLTGSVERRVWEGESLPWVIACCAGWMAGRQVVHFRNIRVQLWMVTAVSLGLGLVLAWQPIAYSMDIFRYLWDGRLMIHGINPYTAPPNAPQFAGLRQGFVYWPDLAWKAWLDDYPPLAQFSFAWMAGLTHGALGVYKLWMVLNHGLTLWLFYRVLKVRRKRQSEQFQHHPLLPSDGMSYACFALCAPLLVESLTAAHVDALALPWLLLAWLAYLHRRPVWLGVFLAAATAVKIVPAVLLVGFLLGNRQHVLRLMGSFFAVLVLLYLPFLSAGISVFHAFTRAAELSYDGSLQTVLGDLLGSPITDHATLLLAGCELTAWAVILFTRARHFPVETKVCLLGLTFLLGSPVIHPWYVVMPLPFAIASREWSTLWFAATIHLTYDQVPWNWALQYAPTYALYARQWWKLRQFPMGTAAWYHGK